MKFWEITSGWHTIDDTVQYILTHTMAIFASFKCFFWQYRKTIKRSLLDIGLN